MTNVHIQPPICTDRALELSWKDSNIRYLDHLGNSDIAEFRCRIDAMSCTLRIIDRFHVDSEGRILSQENFFDPHDVTDPGWKDG